MPRCSANEGNYLQGWKEAEIGAFASFPKTVFSEEVTNQVHNARLTSDFLYFIVTILGKVFSPFKNLSQVLSPSTCLLQFLFSFCISLIL